MVKKWTWLEKNIRISKNSTEIQTKLNGVRFPNKAHYLQKGTYWGTQKPKQEVVLHLYLVEPSASSYEAATKFH